MKLVIEIEDVMYALVMSQEPKEKEYWLYHVKHGKPLDNVLDEIWAEIEPKCDRINSLASVLPYTAHREIQELLCEIMDLCKAEGRRQKAESEEKE